LARRTRFFMRPLFYNKFRPGEGRARARRAAAASGGSAGSVLLQRARLRDKAALKEERSPGLEKSPPWQAIGGRGPKRKRAAAVSASVARWAAARSRMGLG